MALPPYNLLTAPDDQDFQRRMVAQAEALRQQKYMGDIFQIAGTPEGQGDIVGKQLSEQALHGLEQLAAAPSQRQAYFASQLDAAKKKRENEIWTAANDPETLSANRKLFGAMIKAENPDLGPKPVLEAGGQPAVDQVTGQPKMTPDLTADASFDALKALVPQTTKFGAAAAGITAREALLGKKLKEDREKQDRDQKFRARENSLDRDVKKKAADDKAATEPGYVPLTPDAITQSAHVYAKDPKAITALGRSKQGQADRNKIVNRTQELYPTVDLAGMRAGVKADAGSLASLQKQYDATKSFEKTARRNLQTFLDQLAKVPSTFSPLLTKPDQWWAENAAGDPAMTAFNTARQVATQEVSKVVSGQMGNAAVSDSQRKEVAELFKQGASPEQIRAAAKILLGDMDARIQAFEDQLGQIGTRIGGAGQPKPAAPGAPVKLKPGLEGDAQFDALPPGASFIAPDGSTREK